MWMNLIIVIAFNTLILVTNIDNIESNVILT